LAAPMAWAAVMVEGGRVVVMVAVLGAGGTVVVATVGAREEPTEAAFPAGKAAVLVEAMVEVEMVALVGRAVKRVAGALAEVAPVAAR
jgi:hypothetical protein